MTLQSHKAITSRRTLLAVASLVLFGCASRRVENRDNKGSTLVDLFAQDRVSVEVHFFDPTRFIGRLYPDFVRADVPDKVKAALRLDYLHHSPISHFRCRDASREEVKPGFIRGEPPIE